MYKFTHHDLLANNIFYHEELGVKFIDFEYASIDIISFDIANYFRNRERREQMLAGLTQTLREESGYDVEFRIFCNTKKGRSKDEKINYKKCTFHLNLHVPYDE